MPDSTHHVVNLSGGITSWMAGRLVVDRIAQPGDRITLLFADTLIESPDVYRFLEAGAADLGYPVTRIADGRTPWQLMRDHGMIANNLRAICSRILKRELLDKWMDANCSRSNTVSHVGLDWTEGHRVERHVAAKAKSGWKASAPLHHFGIWKHQAIDEAKQRNLPLPDAYREGFGHANCAGMCVRAGIGHWIRLLRVHPERYAVAEGHEEFLRAEFGRDTACILTDRRNGQRVPMPLRALRERIEAEDCAGLDFDEHGGCGCALED